MSGVKRLIEEIADDVGNLMHSEGMEYQNALLKILKERKFIERDSDEDTINMWDESISHLVN